MKNLLISFRSGLMVLSLMLITLGFATDTQAQGYYYNSGGVDAATYNGYQLGYGSGSNDRAYGHSFNINRHKSYRDADSGYRNSGFGDKDSYEAMFRRAFEAGYRDGYAGAPRQVYYPGDFNNNTYYYDNRYPRQRYRERIRNRRFRDRDRVRIYVTPPWYQRY